MENDEIYAGQSKDIAQRWGQRTEDEYFEAGMGTTRPWAFEKKTYEWREEYTEGNAPANAELEDELYGEDGRISAGIYFNEFSNISVSRKNGPESYTPLANFTDAKLHPTILDNIEKMGYKVPTPIQKHALPMVMSGYDLLACSQTGSGKTAAFLIPILSKAITKLSRTEVTVNRPGERRSKASPMVLIILPTRELAIQIFDDTRRFTYQTRVRPAVIYGGAEMRAQKEQLALGCDVLIATPGRLVDAMERGAVALGGVRYLVLDEADRILDQGFEPTVRRILFQSDLPRDEGLHTMMFSATFPSNVQILARDFMKHDYCRLRIGRIGGTTPMIMQKVLKVEESDKEQTLMDLLCSQPPSRTLIFVASKYRADHLDDVLYNHDFPCISLHGDRNQMEREVALQAFKSGKSPILIATSVAARGLDIKDVLHVINYDLCDDIDEYVHRIGRTARAGNPGLATTFYADADYEIGQQLTKLLVECKQNVPDFLSEHLPNINNVSYENDFAEPDSFSQTSQRATSRAASGAASEAASGGGQDSHGYRSNSTGRPEPVASPPTHTNNAYDSYGYRNKTSPERSDPMASPPTPMKNAYDGGYGYRTNSSTNRSEHMASPPTSMNTPYERYGYRSSASDRSESAPVNTAYDGYGYRSNRPEPTGNSSSVPDHSATPQPGPLDHSLTDAMAGVKMKDSVASPTSAWDTDPLTPHHRMSTNSWSASEQAAILGWGP